VAKNVVVVGAGVVGLAAAFEMSRAGDTVTVLTADLPGSRQSIGLTRIFRLAHADGPLTDAAASSLELWEEWERLAGEPLLDRVGLLLTGDMSERDAHLKRYGGLERVAGRPHPLGVAHDVWWREPTGGASRAESTIRFLRSDLDVVLGEATSVDRRGVTLSSGDRVEADSVVVCAGPDTYSLLAVPEPPRKRSVRFSFPVREPLDLAAPCWIQRDDRLCEPFYAVMDGPDHYSVGLSEARSTELSEPEHIRDAHRRTLDVVKRALPGVRPIAERVISCEYSLHANAAEGSPSQEGWDLFEHDGVLGLTGPSLFKFAPFLGRLVVRHLDLLASA
jgi:sarcosine oxidase